MKLITAVLALLLLSYPVYGREGQSGVRTTAALRAAASTSENTNSTEEDVADDETDDQEMETDNETDDMDTEEMDTDDTDTDESDTDESDSDQEMDTDDGDSNGTSMNDDSDDDSDDETDDTDDESNTVKSAILASLQTSALKQSPSSLGQMAAALNAGLSPRQTINALLDTANSGSTAGLVDTSAVAGLSVAPTSGALLAANSAALLSSPLTASAVPEPAVWILAATGVLAPLWKRRRSNRISTPARITLAN